MSHEYAMSRVRDAIEKADGNHLKAQRLLMSWIENDQTLLLGLAGPHLHAILSYAINHVLQPPRIDKKGSGKALKIDADSTGEFGAALLESLKGGRNPGVGFGEPAPRGSTGKPAKASQKHIDAMHKLAAASQKGVDATTGRGGKKK